MKKSTNGAFRVESPCFYRLSEELARYGYPSRLNIQSVRLDPDCNQMYMSVDDDIYVEVTLDNVAYEVLVIGPTSARREHVNPLPRNSVLVPKITGQTVAQAVALAVEGGLARPRPDNQWHEALEGILGGDIAQILTSASTRPSLHELTLAISRVELEEDRWRALSLLIAKFNPRRPNQRDLQAGLLIFQDVFQRHGLESTSSNERAWEAVLRHLRRKPEANVLEIVEMLLYRKLTLNRSQHHHLAEEIHSLWQVIAKDYVAWPKD